MASTLKAPVANQARKRQGVVVRTVTVTRPQLKSAGTESKHGVRAARVAEAAPRPVANAGIATKTRTDGITGKAKSKDGIAAKAKQIVQDRANGMLDSLLSVQGEDHDAKKRPRWFKIATWGLVLTPAFSILIYVVGFFYLLPAEVHGVGLNKSLAATPTVIANGFAVPDQEGVFIQRTAGGRNYLDQILQYNSRTLQPPISAQYSIAPTNFHALLIREAQLETPDQYVVYKISDGHQDVPVHVVGQRLHLPMLAVIALTMGSGQSWAPGDYMIDVPESGLDSADYWAFFQVQ